MKILKKGNLLIMIFTVNLDKDMILNINQVKVVLGKFLKSKINYRKYLKHKKYP